MIVSTITATTWVRSRFNVYPVSERDWGIVHPESDFSSIYDQSGTVVTVDHIPGLVCKDDALGT